MHFSRIAKGCGKHPGEAIHPQVELKAEFGNPHRLVLNYPALSNARIRRNHDDESKESDNSGQVRLGVPRICPKQHSQTAPHKRKRNDRDQVEQLERQPGTLPGSLPEDQLDIAR
jgi:ribosomal protein S30